MRHHRPSDNTMFLYTMTHPCKETRSPQVSFHPQSAGNYTCAHDHPQEPTTSHTNSMRQSRANTQIGTTGRSPESKGTCPEQTLRQGPQAEALKARAHAQSKQKVTADRSPGRLNCLRTTRVRLDKANHKPNADRPGPFFRQLNQERDGPKRADP